MINLNQNSPKHSIEQNWHVPTFSTSGLTFKNQKRYVDFVQIGQFLVIIFELNQCDTYFKKWK